MLAVNFHLMGGMPNRPQPPCVDPGEVAVPPVLRAESAVVDGAAVPRDDAPPEVVLRRPIALGLLLAKVRENLR